MVFLAMVNVLVLMVMEPMVSMEMNLNFLRPIIKEEVRKVVFGMSALTDPRHDGFYGLFFH